MARNVSRSCEGLGSFRLWSGELVGPDEARPLVRLEPSAEASRLLELAFSIRRSVLSKVAAQGAFELPEVPKPRL
jgi:hypothetical protein